MIAEATGSTSATTRPAWHVDFLSMLPAIERHARVAFRELSPVARDEAVQETICNALLAYRQLVARGKVDVAYPSPLARYGVAQFRAGRRVGSRLNKNDALSSYAQRQRGFRVDSLDKFDEEVDGWREIVVEDRRAGPAEIAATRIDFSQWLKTLTAKQRKIANALAVGESTQVVASKYGLSAGRISQIRRQFKDAWDGFTADRVELAAA
jgi:hypothetical protein